MPASELEAALAKITRIEVFLSPYNQLIRQLIQEEETKLKQLEEELKKANRKERKNLQPPIEAAKKKSRSAQRFKGRSIWPFYRSRFCFHQP